MRWMTRLLIVVTIVSIVSSASISVGVTPTGQPDVEVHQTTCQAYVDQNGDGEISWVEAFCWWLEFYWHNGNIPE